jgi:ribonuclease BN (tRNA processing enzyme)
MIDLTSTMATVARNSPNMPAAAKANLEQHLSTHHLTPTEVGKLAAKAGVRSLIITHYAGGTPDRARQQAYMAEIQVHFKGAVKLAEDLDRH